MLMPSQKFTYYCEIMFNVEKNNPIVSSFVIKNQSRKSLIPYRKTIFNNSQKIFHDKKYTK